MCESEGMTQVIECLHSQACVKARTLTFCTAEAFIGIKAPSFPRALWSFLASLEKAVLKAAHSWWQAGLLGRAEMPKRGEQASLSHT
jgi:hypothetical protein